MEHPEQSTEVPGPPPGARPDRDDALPYDALLLRARRLEVVGRLVGGVAHDFNNVLTAIRGYADLLLMEDGMPEESLWQLDEIRKSSDRAAGLTRQLLAFSRRRAEAPRPVSLNAVVAGVERLVDRMAGEGIRVRTALEPGLGPVHADPGDLEQVVMNAAAGACDALPGGGTLTIETSTVEGEDGGRCVLLAVHGAGEGRGAVEREEDPGLALVRRIVARLGGRVRMDRAEEGGSALLVHLPLRGEGEEAPPPGPPPRGRETILLVDDDDLVRPVLHRGLVRQGYRVIDARGAAEALSAAREHPGPVDLLLTDVAMPGGDGRELARRMRERHPRTRVVYMSGYADDSLIREGELEPGAAFLPKPVSMRELAARVRAVLDAPAA